jgi:hypothetical protein
MPLLALALLLATPPQPAAASSKWVATPEDSQVESAWLRGEVSKPTTPVPEPVSPLAVFAVGAVGWVLGRRRDRTSPAPTASASA